MKTCLLKMGRATLCITLTCVFGCLQAQFDKPDFTCYTYHDGLSNDYVTSLWQDTRGYLWIGTDNGLNRFDGNRFEKYYQDDHSGWLKSPQIRGIKPLSDDRFAILTTNRAVIIRETDFHSMPLFVPDSTTFFSMQNAVWDLIEMPGKGYAVTTATGFYCFDVIGNLSFRYDAFTRTDAANTRIHYGRHLLSIRDNKTLVYVQDDQQALYDLASNTFNALTPESPYWSPLCHPPGRPHFHSLQIADREYLIAPQRDSLIYYNMDSGITTYYKLPFAWSELSWRSRIHLLDDTTFAINGGQNGFLVFHLDRRTGQMTGGHTRYFKDEVVNAVFLDKQRRLWIATTKGLWKQNLQTPFIRMDTISIPAVASNRYANDRSPGSISSVLLHRDKLYLGRYAQDCGLVILNPDNLETEQYFCMYDQSGYNATISMQMYHMDTIWLGTADGIIWFDVITHTYGKLEDIAGYAALASCNVLSPAGKDSLAWLTRYLGGNVMSYHIGTREIRVFAADSDPPKPFSRIKHITHDAEGNVWFSGHGLARWNRQTQLFDTLITVYGGPNAFDENIVMMVADSYGSLWIVNPRNGLLQYDILQKEWMHFGLNDIIPSLAIESISPLIGHEIWFGDANHLFNMDIRTNQVDIYDHKDGLVTGFSDFYYMYYDSTRERMHLFNGDQISYWDVSGDVREIPSGELIVQRIIVNGDSTIHFPNGALVFSAAENNLTFDYTIVDYEDGPGYEFSYRIGPESPWVQLGSQRQLFLTKLIPGRYAVEVKARASNGLDKTRLIRFTIARPFWTSHWFILLCGAVLVVFIYLIYRRRIASIKSKASLDKQLADAELKALHAQMNPHFIFNSLNSIREMMLHQNINEAARYLNVFADLIRMTLDQSRQHYISLKDTIGYLERYVEMENIRNSEFTFQLMSDPMLDEEETMLPPLLIQPFIENAIWHGMNGARQSIHISVSFTRQNDHLVCVIRDDGVGIHTSVQHASDRGRKHRPVGISNIQKRIELLNQKHTHHSAIRIEDRGELTGGQESGTQVTIILPLEISMT